MALVHEPDRAHDFHLCGLFLVVFGIIAAAVPFLQIVVSHIFALFE